MTVVRHRSTLLLLRLSSSSSITVTPDGEDKAKVTFDVNGGQFTMGGAATRAKK